MSEKNLTRVVVNSMPLGGLPKTDEEIMADNGLTALIRLNCNENPLGTSPKALEAIRANAVNVNRYPESGSTLLRTKIAAKYNLEPANVTLSNGGDNIITTIMGAFVDSGQEILIGDPSFFVYGLAGGIMGGKLKKVPMTDFTYDLPAMLQAITPQTKLVVIINPNNPTSTMIGQKAIDEFMAQVPDHVLVVMDEAYGEFAGDDFPDTIKHVRAGKNLLVIKTFSKFYGLAGLRIGYALAKPEIIDGLRKVIETFPVNILAQSAALAGLDDQEFLKKSVAHVVKCRQYFTEEFAKLGMAAPPAAGNFMFVNAHMDTTKLAADLEKQGILIKPGASWGYPEYFRFSFGTDTENRKFIDALTEIKNR